MYSQAVFQDVDTAHAIPLTRLRVGPAAIQVGSDPMQRAATSMGGRAVALRRNS